MEWPKCVLLLNGGYLDEAVVFFWIECFWGCLFIFCFTDGILWFFMSFLVFFDWTLQCFGCSCDCLWSRSSSGLRPFSLEIGSTWRLVIRPGMIFTEWISNQISSGCLGENFEIWSNQHSTRSTSVHPRGLTDVAVNEDLQVYFLQGSPTSLLDLQRANFTGVLEGMVLKVSPMCLMAAGF